ncbi:P1 family peptidase [Rhodovastum atsumiense]|uniref:P1 family peptidase n=1 Tax=Rhodovastum atsumiense TaxID=504468 RepID=A0A5M6IJI7_9PROT|nr:P1 family peptidase [Rhodovastum atsumiense]KAA5608410.1 P1 family peptidase [Rhodovastum atsumiense]CAH2599401.1 P1 family peptidase [Rhodovastum atsumiense]
MALNLITDVVGLAVGHASDPVLASGVTAILFDPPAVASVAVLGGAPGGHDTTMLEPHMTVERIDAVVLSGGSVFGLDAAGGVQAALREAGRGFRLGPAVVPLASAAILFDLLNGGDKNWGRFPPYRELGYAAAVAARPGEFPLGTVGAGAGATTVTLKGGLGSASAVTPSGHTVGAIVAVNAVGTATLGDGPWFWAAPFEQGTEFGGRGWPSQVPPEALELRIKRAPGTSTTIALVATDATLTKPQAKRLAIMANDGLARAILPAHAPMDGDTVFAAATGRRPLADEEDLTELGHLAAMVLARAVARGVYEATALPFPGALPAWRDRFG